MAISTENARNLLKSSGEIIKNAAADLLASSDFISRTIGMNNSYEDIMLLVQALGRQPVSLLGKDYVFIFDHVRRIYEQGVVIPSTMYGGGEYGCTKFTFYKERPTVKFADIYNDPLNLLGRWTPDFVPNSTKSEKGNFFYAESNDGVANNKTITNAESNLGTASGQYSSSFQNLAKCDLIKKTNENFQHGMFNTLIARFHTNNMDSRDAENPTQTAISKTYGMSHGRNLLKVSPDEPNGYNNPYCRVWTYHHQYHTMVDAMRPFGGGSISSAQQLENTEISGEYDTVGFRTLESKNYGIKGGSERLDTHGVLNYENGFVNIAPTAKVKDYFEGKEDNKDRKTVSVKRCMFSLENLAWRDSKSKPQEFEAYGLSAEQKGPLGGRIMWFPPYDITFNENVSVKWNSNEFIGRGENIYTYTNTERRGNLSFTLVIDHPSILDYWTGHERNDMKNQGVDLLPGNTDGVDGIKNQEQTLLRFFAGCDVLSAKPHTYRSRAENVEVPPEEPVENDLPQENPTEPDEAKPPTAHKLFCVLYYPNNYSGVDDTPFGNNFKVNAVYYLMNGIGTQMRVNELDAKAYDLPTLIDEKVTTPLFSTCGGYEMTDVGISLGAQPLDSNEARRKTYADTTSEEIKAQYLTTAAGDKIPAGYGGDTVDLAKIIGDEALTYAQVGDKNWFQKRWYYRVDNVYKNDVLTHDTSYIDMKSYKLNSTGYKNITSVKRIIGDEQEGGETGFHLISFSDLFYALEGEKNKVVNKVNDSDVKLIQEILDHEKNGIKIKKISFRGHASAAGYGSSNANLADYRAKTFKAWMMGAGFPKPEEGDAEIADYVRQDGANDNANNGDANQLLAKMWRSASVTIEYEQSEVTDAKKQSSEAQVKNGTVSTDESGRTLNKVDKVINQNTQKTISPGKLNTARDWLYNTEQGSKLRREGYWEEEDVVMANGKTVRMKVHKSINPWTFTMRDAERILGKNFTDPTKFDYDDSYKQAGEKSGVVKRYDNEGEFFQLLEKDDPFLHHLITDKIKYFDPAYHAISPEGFNARLTFLHQCTRQGATIGNSDENVQTAWNLAFGRPPVCVLRLGDFYYTKIIINSMTLNYDNPQWDLNPEGIGVMPMFCKVNLDFTFIGGSDLAGPIARLQNAVSFNYYANTSVYDNRAERVEYDPAKTGKEIAYKPFNYPNKPGRRTAGIVDDKGNFRKTDTSGEWEDV